MVDRIKEILSSRQLSPTQFADAIGVARPVVSHILGGRNKPSLEVVQKIIAAFPDLSLPWLLSGVGDMVAMPPTPLSVPAQPAPVSNRPAKPPKPSSAALTGSKSSVPPSPVVPAPETSIPKGPEAVDMNMPGPNSTQTPLPLFAPIAAPATPVAPPAAGPVALPENYPANHAPVQPPALSAAPAQPTPYTVPAQPAPASSTAQERNMAQALAEPGKAIRRIVIFYTDGTFSAYQPED